MGSPSINSSFPVLPGRTAAERTWKLHRDLSEKKSYSLEPPFLLPVVSRFQFHSDSSISNYLDASALECSETAGSIHEHPSTLSDFSSG